MKLEKKSLPNDKSIEFSADTLMQACHGNAYNAGWWHNLDTGEFEQERNFGDICALIVSEISEAYEGHRKNSMDDHLTEYPMVHAELADAMIRILDYCGGMNIPIGKIMAEKMAYNRNRADHKVENRKKDGGKKL